MSSDTHIYLINRARLLVLPAIWLLFVGLLLGVVGRSAEPGAAALGEAISALLTLILGPIFYFTVWRSRLVLDAQGIAHHQFGYTVRSSWANLESLSMRKGMEGLYLKEPGTDSRVLRGSTRILQRISILTGMPSGFGDADALAVGRFITLAPFTSHLHGGPLSQDLERWAPQLFAGNGGSSAPGGISRAAAENK